MSMMFLLACTTPSPVDSEGSDTAEGPLTATATLSEIVPTVVSVTVVNDGPVLSGVEVTYRIEDGPETIITAEQSGETYRATLLGLKASTTYTWSASALIDGQTVSSEPQTITTASPPSHLPSLTFSGDVDLTGYLVTSILSVPSVAVIIDADGDYVWWYEATTDGVISRSRISHDGTALIFLDPIKNHGQDTTYQLLRVALDGSSVASIPGSDGAHHDFIEIEDGLYAQIQHDSREIDGEVIKGDRLVEVSADGEQAEIWTVWDHLEYDPDQEQVYLDWTHANALDYDEDAGAYTVSLCAFSTIYHIDRATGDVRWKLGGSESDFRSDDPTLVPFVRQHQFELFKGGIVVFDNQAYESQESRVVEYALDAESGVLSHTWSYTPDPAFYTHGLGDVSRLSSGNTRIVWSAQGQIDEVTPEGEIRWQLNASLGGGFGYVEWVASLGE